MTTAECVAKALPMVLLHSAGHEEGNAHYLAHNGAAVMTVNKDDTVSTVLRLLRNPSRLKEMSDNARRLQLPSTQLATEIICRELEAARRAGGFFRR